MGLRSVLTIHQSTTTVRKLWIQQKLYNSWSRKNTITADSKIQGDLNLDSVDLISLVASIEIKFSIELNEETLLPIETLQQLADIIDQNINHAWI